MNDEQILVLARRAEIYKVWRESGCCIDAFARAIERQALERAYSAVKALRQTNTFRIDNVTYMNEGIDDAADAIRALIEQVESKERQG